MSNTEDTPFVIEFKNGGQTTNYGSAQPTSQSNLTGNGTDAITAPSPQPQILYCLHGHTNIEVRDHCHYQRSDGVDMKARKKLIIASILCLFFMICEIVGGVLSSSLAIATDAAHLLTDFGSFMISLFAIWIAGRPSTQRMSFGWYRAEVIGALASVVMIWFITAILVWLAVQRIITRDFEVDAKIMLITSGLAILVNLVMGCQLQHGHSHGGDHDHAMMHNNETIKMKTPQPSSRQPPTRQSSQSAQPQLQQLRLPVVRSEATSTDADTLSRTTVARSQVENGAVATAKDHPNINVRAAYIHVLGDIVQSVGVFVAALFIFFRPDWAIVDPICTFIFSIIVLLTTFTIMKDTLLVLMEGTPSYLHYAEVLHIFQQIPGVQRVHNLRIWALSINKVALSVHLAISPGANPRLILQEATQAVHKRYKIFETTIQIEDFTPQMESCHQCTVPER